MRSRLREITYREGKGGGGGFHIIDISVCFRDTGSGKDV